MSLSLIDLASHGVDDVRTCTNGKEALALYSIALEAKKPYSAVIMDLTIPGGVGGVLAAQYILEIDPKARLIVSSGYSNDPVLADCAKFGFRSVLTKPYDTVEIVRVLDTVLCSTE